MNPQKRETPEIIRNTMLKKVNIIAQIPIRTVYPPIYGTYKGVVMSPSVILKCIMHKAIVEEVLSNGETIRLNAKNYNTINDPETEEVKKAILENRESAVIGRREDTRDITMKKLVNHTAPLPESHFLYNIKETCNSAERMDHSEAERLDAAYVDRQSNESITAPERDMSTIDSESGEVTGDSL